MTSITGRNANPAQRGFTLLELVLVMLILSIIAAVAAPQLRGFIGGRRNTDAAAQIIALSQYARTQAVSSGATYRFNLDTQTQTYWLTVQRGAGFGDLGNEFGRRFRLPDGTVAQWTSEPGTHNYMEFFADGHVESAPLQLVADRSQVFEIGCRSETEPLIILRRETL